MFKLVEVETGAVLAEWEAEYIEERKDQSHGSESIPITFYIFGATIVISVALLLFGLRRLANTQYPYSEAEIIKNEYNEKLLKEIIEENK